MDLTHQAEYSLAKSGDCSSGVVVVFDSERKSP